MKIRQEINVMCGASSGGTSGTFDAEGIVELDTTQYTGATYYFEAVYNGAASNTGTIRLRRVGTTTDDATLAGATSATYIRTRSASFSPPAGQTEYKVTAVGDGVRQQAIRAGRIIILQDSATITDTMTQIEVGNLARGLTNTSVADITDPKYWTYTAANWDGTKAFSAEVVWTTSAKNTTTITLCRTSDNATNVTIVSAGSNSTGYTRTRVSFTPVDGETYKIRSLSSTTKSNYSIACAKIVVDQTASPTKLQPEFLMLNTNDTSATGLQTRQTQWNSTEWDASAGTITYKHAMDSNNAANSAKVRDITASADITNSTVTGTGQQVSAALGTLTTGNELDTWVLDTTGVVAGSRILVLYSFVAAAARRIFVTGG